MQVGKLYKYICFWTTGIHPSLDEVWSILTALHLRQDDTFLLLEIAERHNAPCYRILTTTGKTGWIDSGKAHFELLEIEQ